MRRAASGSPRASVRTRIRLSARRVRPSLREGLPAEGLAAPSRDVRSEDREVDADRRPASRRTISISPTTDNTLWFSGGGLSDVVGWLDIEEVRPRPDEAKAQGWTPLIIDTNGNGKRDAFVEPNEPVDPTKDKRFIAAFYGVAEPGGRFDVGQSMARLLARRSARLHPRVAPGPIRQDGADRRSIEPPEGNGARAAWTSTTDGVVWTALASGHLASFDRRKCKGPLNGPQAATGKHCPEGWKLYRMPGPQFKGLASSGSGQPRVLCLGRPVDTLGLGKNIPIARQQRDSLFALVNGKLVTCACRIRWASSPRASTAASTIRTAAGRARACGPRRARAPCSITKAAREPPEGLQGAGAARPAGEVTPERALAHRRRASFRETCHEGSARAARSAFVCVSRACAGDDRARDRRLAARGARRRALLPLREPDLRRGLGGEHQGAAAPHHHLDGGLREASPRPCGAEQGHRPHSRCAARPTSRSAPSKACA